MRVLAIAVMLLLTACAEQTVKSRSVHPTQALIYTDKLNVIMSDGALCVGHRPRRGRSWTGALSGCPHLWPYQVADLPASLRPRNVMQPVSERPAGGPVLSFDGSPVEGRYFTLP